MEKGTIKKIFDYYFENPKFKEEIFRAMKEFFNRPDLAPGSSLELQDEREEAMFNEWLVFDFKLKNGKTLLEDFYEKNPYNLNPVRLQVYKDLQENYFGLYEVKEVELGKGLVLESIQTGKVYKVREFLATLSLRKGDVFSARVGKVGDHYELVGSNPAFGPVRLDSKIKNTFRKEKTKLNPKILRDWLFGNEKDEFELPERFSTFYEAEENLKRVLEKYELDRFVDTETIKEWIYHNYLKGSPGLSEFNLLVSLLYPDREDYSNAFTELLESFNAFYNFCPQKEFGGKSPIERGKELDKIEAPPEIEISFHSFSVSKWGKKYSQALDLMKEKDFKKALKKINEIFSFLLKHKITYPEIYRIYANKGVCHLGLGEEEFGEFFLEIAIELNPFYNFAKEQLKRYKKAKSTFALAGKKNEEKQNPNQDIGFKYYQFLKPLKINFAHPVKETFSVPI